MKVAICISGVPRGYYNTEFVKAVAANYETKVFIFYWEPEHILLKQSFQESFVPDMKFDPNVYGITDVEVWYNKGIFTKMAPEFQRRYDEIPEEFRLLKKLCFHSQCYTLMKVNEMREFYEEFHGFKFDCVIRSRFESRFFRKEGPYSRFHLDRYDFNKLYKPLIHVDLKYGMSDAFAMSNSSNMSHYFRIYDRITELSKIEGLHAETLFYHHNKHFGIDSTRIIDGYGFSGYGYHCDDIQSNWY